MSSRAGDKALKKLGVEGGGDDLAAWFFKVMSSPRDEESANISCCSFHSCIDVVQAMGNLSMTQNLHCRGSKYKTHVHVISIMLLPTWISDSEYDHIHVIFR